jgi:hypothetical protein
VQAALEAVLGERTVIARAPVWYSSIWYVRFVGAYAGQDVPKLGLDIGLKSGIGTPSEVWERINGGTVSEGGTRLMADFDDGSANRDAFGLYGVSGTGQRNRQATGADGDSGGPALIGGDVAGVISSGVTTGLIPDADWDQNFTFGEFEVFTRVSSYAARIDGIDSGRTSSSSTWPSSRTGGTTTRTRSASAGPSREASNCSWTGW